MEFIKSIATKIAIVVEGNIIEASLFIILCFVVFSFIEAKIEEVIWGESFFHSLDWAFMGCFIYFFVLVFDRCLAIKAMIVIQGFKI